MSKTYNGHPSYNSWNIALWFGGDEALYRLAKECKRRTRTIEDAAARMMECLPAKTPDGVRYTKTNVIRALRGL